MATRAIVKIEDETQATLAVLYKHWDGYPDGLGKILRDAVRGVKLVNGYGEERIPTHFNGIGCFAAYLIGHLKGTQIGDVYLVAPSEAIDMGQEWEYTVRPTANGRIQVIPRAV